MEIQNKEFNEYCLRNFGKTISEEEFEVIINQIIQDINKLHVLNVEIRKIAIEVLEKMFETIVKNEKIDIEKEIRKTTVEVLEEVGKFKVKNENEKRIVIIVCEYIKMTIK